MPGYRFSQQAKQVLSKKRPCRRKRFFQPWFSPSAGQTINPLRTELQANIQTHKTNENIRIRKRANWTNCAFDQKDVEKMFVRIPCHSSIDTGRGASRAMADPPGWGPARSTPRGQLLSPAWAGAGRRESQPVGGCLKRWPASGR